MKIATNKIILLLIIITAIVLRFFHYFDIPYTHDEFSALYRLNFSSFSDLIEYGVKIDGHPAGIHIFLYYWTKLFGVSEWVVKLPFMVFGILSVLLIYLIAKKWYNESVGLISASFLASIQFTVMYSQIARPYISGLFFSLLMVYYWTKIMRQPHKQFYLNSILFIISASLCAYNHHFSLLFAAIVGLSGLFYIKKQYFIKYIVSGIVIFLLYIPHLNIFVYQLNMGGIEGWLGKPHNDFFINFIGYIFNFSNLSIVLTILLILYGFYKNSIKNIFNKNILLFTSWFILPFLIGFFYSRYFEAVLQYSVLIFSFPFLFFVIFGHIKPQKTYINLIIVIAIIGLNTYSLTTERQHYKLFYNSPFKQIIVDYNKTKENNDKIISIIDSHKRISKYYITKHNIDTNFVWYDSFKTENEFIEYLNIQSKKYNHLYLGCLSSNKPLTVPIIQDYYPTIVWQKNYAGGTTFLFSNKKQRDKNIVELLDFESEPNKAWSSVKNEYYIDTISVSGKKSYLINEKTEYSPTYTSSLNNFIWNKNDFIDISVKANNFNNIDDIILVASLESSGKSIYWGGTSFDKFIENRTDDEWITAHHSIKLSDIYLNYNDIQLKVYIWNKGKQQFVIDDFTIKLREGNSIIYSLNEKF